ncbi:helix-turn-helix domain-containing protein [Agromyces albus]|uniref:XRE family transcriptional regulator n=1 Tax=Agromyces albus TaxID=205332 RepID=A0A4Q2L4C4_9MICO|nr:helix-turn-helix transcriptional regulator [Agromyces albus]RXZ73054.1 XRE family transcriptional regulator [Agromyces albus]
MGKVVEFTRATGSPTSKPLWRHVLGEVLRGERLEQERILTEVASTAGVSPQYLSEIERGRKEPSSEVLGSVADALGLALVDVVRRVGEVLGERQEAERRNAERRELLRVEASFAFRADAVPEHPLATPDAMPDIAMPDPAPAPARFDAYLLAA